MGSSSKKDKHHSSRKHEKESKRERKESKRTKTSKVIDDDADEWVEKPAAGTSGTTKEAPEPGKGVEVIPSNQSLKVHANPSSAVREDWLGLGHSQASATGSSTSSQFDPRAKGRLAVEDDFTDGFGRGENGGPSSDPFGSLGTSSSSRQARLQRQAERDAERATKPQMSAREINTAAFGGSEGAGSAAPPPPAKKQKVEYGGAGSSWRMTKLKRAYEAAEEEGRSLEEVGLERYGSREAWEEALAERRHLDSQANPQLASSVTKPGPVVDEFGREVRADETSNAPSQAGATSGNPATRFLFNQTSAGSDYSRPSSRQSFRRPGESPMPGTSAASSRFSSPKPSTPIPSVITPTVAPRPSTLSRADTAEDFKSSSSATQSLSPTSLNRLQAKVLKAKLMDPDSVETQELQRQYDEALQARHEQGNAEEAAEVRVLPSLDGRGQLYDLGGASAAADAAERAQLSKRQKRKRDEQFESRDAQGNLIRYNADDDQQSLADLVRSEKFGGGSAEDKDLNKQLAGRIARDSGFQNDLEYMDDQAEKLGRKKARDEDRKRMWAIQDYARTQKALDSCWYCHQEDSNPRVPVVAMGTRAYLALNRFEGLSEAHCLIVPVSHHLSSLEADEDTWDEMKNFMKTLMQMASEFDHGVIFYETAMNLKSQRHTVIEAVPVPWRVYEDAPGYFKESILMAESEWSQNKRLIDFSQRPGGFRRSMVPNLPYFAVQFDYKGQEGYGHIIEGHDGVQGGEEGHDLDEAEKGGGKFERYFAAEIIGNLLELEPRRWRKPKRLDAKNDAARVAQFRRAYDQFDWTKMLDTE